MVVGLSVFGGFSIYIDWIVELLLYCIRIVGIRGNVGLCWQDGLFSGEY